MHNTGWYEYIFPTQQRGKWNPGGLVLYQASGAALILAEGRPGPGDSKGDSGEGNPRVLVLYQEEWGSVDPGGEPSNSREFQAA